MLFSFIVDDRATFRCSHFAEKPVMRSVVARELYEEIFAPQSDGEGFADRLATWGIGHPSNEVDAAFPEPLPVAPMPTG